jgi:hypothetical protein
MALKKFKQDIKIVGKCPACGKNFIWDGGWVMHEDKTRKPYSCIAINVVFGSFYNFEKTVENWDNKNWEYFMKG